MDAKFAIENMMDTVVRAFKDWGLKSSTIKNYGFYGINHILRKYRDCGRKYYDSDFTSEIIDEILSKRTESKNIKSWKHHLRKIEHMLRELYETDKIEHKKCRTGSRTKLETPYYSEMLDKFDKSEYALGLRSSGTIVCSIIMIRHFFAWLESTDCKNLRDITLAGMGRFLTQFSGRNQSSVGRMMTELRKFYEFTQRNSIPCLDFTPALIARPAKRRKLRPYISFDEGESILKRIDTSLSLGKRDYAIIMIAKELGIRSGDIRNLKRADICWENDEIKFSQSKTGAKLTLPLNSVVGNAIADYLLNGRPESDSEYIFIRHMPPHIKLSTLDAVFRRYASMEQYERFSGFHGFRRGLASRLLNAGVASDTTKNILGQMKIDSLKPYARITDARLKSCALDIGDYHTKQEELLL